MHKFTIAIVTPQLLEGLGLKSILEKIVGFSEIEIFNSFADFADGNNSHFAHYFISEAIFEQNKGYFIECGMRAIVLVSTQGAMLPGGVLTLNINQSEEMLVHDILKLRNHSPRQSHSIKSVQMQGTMADNVQLTPREKEVLNFIVQGCINKEIAEKMGIGLTTVISHRKNIISKLGIKSVAALTIYAIHSGLVDPELIIH